eukprot:gene19461-25343_t
MFKVIVLLASLLSVAAFAPVRMVKSSSLRMSALGEEGVLPPTGFWDPLGLSVGQTDETLLKYRAAELKHGRVAQLAVIGYIAQEIARLPGDLNGVPFTSIPNGVAALSAIPAFGWFQIGASLGYWEIFGWKQVEGSTPGDFGFYSGKPLSSEELTALKTKELQNGRIAMLAIAELLTHDIAKPAGESLFTIHHF